MVDCGAIPASSMRWRQAGLSTARNSSGLGQVPFLAMKLIFLWLTCMAALILVMLFSPQTQANRAVGCFAAFCFAIGLAVTMTCYRSRA